MLTNLLAAVVLEPGYAAKRARFIRMIKDILGSTSPVVFWLPNPSDTTTSVDEGAGNRIWTAETTMGGRFTRLGNGYSVAFNGTSNYLNSPDTANLTYGDGLADSAFSVITVANVTSVSAIRTMFSKFDASNYEYQFRLGGASHILQFAIGDLDQSPNPRGQSTVAIVEGAWQVFGGSYDGGGGATAASGITLYRQGIAFGVTAINDALYLAMSNGTGLGSIGAENTAGTPSTFFPGSLAMVLVVGANLSATQHAAISDLCRRHFRL